MDSVKIRRMLVFLGVTFIVDWSLAGILWWTGLSKVPNMMMGLAMIYMLVPGITAIVLIKCFWKEKLADYGFSFKLNPFWLLAWAVPVLIAFGTLGVALLLRQGTFDPQLTAYLANLKAQMGADAFEKAAEPMKATLPYMGLIMVVQGIVAGTTINAVLAFGEEMGWRGLLQKLTEGLGFLPSALLIGVIWGIWHAPLILMGHNFPEAPVAGVFVMTGGCIFLGILMSYIRAKTKSVIAASVTHGVFNGLAGLAIVYIAGSNSFFKNPLGFSGWIAMAALVLILGALALLFPKVFGVKENKEA